MNSPTWQFHIDVGGTFTDVVAVRPDGATRAHKVLSSGRTVGRVDDCAAAANGASITDARRAGDPENFWAGYLATFLDGDGVKIATSLVVSSRSDSGQLNFDAGCDLGGGVGCAYELSSDEQAPVLAIRYLMGLCLHEPIGSVEVRLGTTRATNALLERKGAAVALVTTKGFGDVLRIGNQDRPDLFKLDIQKRDELTQVVVEIDERLDAAGRVLRSPNEAEVRSQLEALRLAKVETLAICFVHAYVNPVHEELVARIAEKVGFRHVSVSSRVARMQRLVPRADTTVVDAYLTPVIRDYVQQLRRSLPDARVQMMTSNGGLIEASSALGKDTILSGPAGGVVGCAHVANRAGFDKTIGFDMGGTSTDVSRIELRPRRFEYQHETVKAGVRIMTPMLAVETVAAGGGSICAFDGEMLTVGPHSAGADPGPACYGRGGPLTITDMNLVLGRLVPEHFPFRLDHVAVMRKLDTLRERVCNTSPTSPTRVSLAEGFVRIANEKMAAAIKRISLAKGFDVREYALTTFGGAGAQHACAVARMLGMKRVLCSASAGVLSAVGIGVADVKRVGQRSVCVRLNNDTAKTLEPVFDTMESGLRSELLAEGVAEVQLEEPVRSIDVRYVNQASAITIVAEPLADACERFEAEHEQLYGYRHGGRAMEISAVHVELVSRSRCFDVEADGEATCEGKPATPAQTTEMLVDGKRHEVPVYLRAELDVGAVLRGPCIVIEQTSTVVVDAGWSATASEVGGMLLTDGDEEAEREVVPIHADPIYLELFNNQFAAIAEQMGATLRRTALSTNVKERLDYSCAIFAPNGDLVVNAPHIPVHLGGMSDCVKALIEDVGFFGPGDAYVTNDPYRGGSHLNDVTVITPVHGADGRSLLFFVASRAHHAEIGGTKPGSMPPDSTSLAQEGVLIRAMPWVLSGQSRHAAIRDVLTTGQYPSRTPDENLADIAAQAAANQTGVRELQLMVHRFGIEAVHRYMRHIQDAAERKMRSALARLPRGTHRFEDRMDDATCIRLAVTIHRDRATLDFSGTAPVHPGNLNANQSIVRSAVLYCFRCILDEDVPLNAGVLAPIDIVLPACFLNPPAAVDAGDCAAMVGGNVETSQRIVDCVFGALQAVAASQGTMNNLLIGNERFGYYETICGGAGAGDGFNGADAVHTHMTNTRLTDVEILEARIPVRVVRFEIRRSSGGAGKHRGGDGVIRELEFLEPLDVSIISQRRTTAPYGLEGASAGARGRNLIRRAGESQTEELPSIVHLRVDAGDRLTIETPGGGGWGDPESVAGVTS